MVFLMTVEIVQLVITYAKHAVDLLPAVIPALILLIETFLIAAIVLTDFSIIIILLYVLNVTIHVLLVQETLIPANPVKL